MWRLTCREIQKVGDSGGLLKHSLLPSQVGKVQPHRLSEIPPDGLVQPAKAASGGTQHSAPLGLAGGQQVITACGLRVMSPAPRWAGHCLWAASNSTRTQVACSVLRETEPWRVHVGGPDAVPVPGPCPHPWNWVGSMVKPHGATSCSHSDAFGSNTSPTVCWGS